MECLQNNAKACDHRAVTLCEPDDFHKFDKTTNARTCPCQLSTMAAPMRIFLRRCILKEIFSLICTKLRACAASFAMLVRCERARTFRALVEGFEHVPEGLILLLYEMVLEYWLIPSVWFVSQSALSAKRSLFT